MLVDVAVALHTHVSLGGFEKPTHVWLPVLELVRLEGLLDVEPSCVVDERGPVVVEDADVLLLLDAVPARIVELLGLVDGLLPWGVLAEFVVPLAAAVEPGTAGPLPLPTTALGDVRWTRATVTAATKITVMSPAAAQRPPRGPTDGGCPP